MPPFCIHIIPLTHQIATTFNQKTIIFYCFK
nr:MAG TPA: hypothetical protein [Caudoviricetes sp.]